MGEVHGFGPGPRRNPVQVPHSHFILTSIPSEFPRIDVSGRARGLDEMDSAVETTSTSKVRRIDFSDCGPGLPTRHLPALAESVYFIEAGSPSGAAGS